MVFWEGVGTCEGVQQQLNQDIPWIKLPCELWFGRTVKTYATIR